MSLGLLVPLLFALLAQGATQEKPYDERVFVERVVVNVHVVDNLGRPNHRRSYEDGEAQ